MAKRKRLSQATEAEIMSRSRRRCCICFALQRDVSIKPGQIAHLDRDPSNAAVDNLAFLCLPHHDQYDSSTSQSKNLTLSEVKRYRQELYEHVLTAFTAQDASERDNAYLPQATTAPKTGDGKHDLRTVAMEILSDRVGAMISIPELAAKLSITNRTAQKIVMELAEEGIVRVDRTRGNPKCRYSLASSIDNRMIDSFISQLQEQIISDDRFLRRGAHEIDAVIRTGSGNTYVLDAVEARSSLHRTLVTTQAHRLARAKEAMGISNAIDVIVIGITDTTDTHGEDLRSVERADLLIRYVEIEQESPPTQHP